MRTYEAMFLMEPTLATDWPAAEAEINRMLERADAKLLGIKSWGERKLAYPIGHRKRGLYALSFFDAAPDKIPGLERDVQLSEKAVRVLVLRRDNMTPEAIEKVLAAEPPAKTPARDDYGFRPRPQRSEEAGRADRTPKRPDEPTPDARQADAEGDPPTEALSRGATEGVAGEGKRAEGGTADTGKPPGVEGPTDAPSAGEVDATEE
ncbi:MAG: 30S ribosomal protein S6 [Phycisphaerae bacterium]|nr:30S ribosomal protein S6 [Phycisphaerae bacterium]